MAGNPSPFSDVTETVFADKTVLDEEYQPSKILERDAGHRTGSSAGARPTRSGARRATDSWSSKRIQAAYEDVARSAATR